jgi:hypothetical protein
MNIDDFMQEDGGSTPPPPPPPPSPPGSPEPVGDSKKKYLHDGKPASVNEVEDSIDKLMLTIFETMRSDPSLSKSEEKSQEILDVYYTILNQVDHLIGIDKSKQDIENDSFQISKEYDQCQKIILARENELREIQKSIKEKLFQVCVVPLVCCLCILYLPQEMSDDYLGINKASKLR